MTRTTGSISGRTLHGLALGCSALVLGLTLSHVLQAPGSRSLDGPAWLDVMHTFYGGFAVVGGAAETVGLLSSAGLAVLMLVHHRPAAATWATAAGLAMLGTLLAYGFGNRPVNTLVAGWTGSTLPADFSAARDTWEVAHAISAALSATAFLILAIMLLTAAYPTSARRRRKARDLPAQSLSTS